MVDSLALPKQHFKAYSALWEIARKNAEVNTRCYEIGQRLFPWGNEWDPDAANYSKLMPDGKVDEKGLSPVGQYPQGASPYGIEDLLGNVSEWVADVYDPNYYQKAPDHNPYNAPGPEGRSDIQHSRRGGNWATRLGYLHSAWRIDRPDQTSDTIGFHCARNP